jgi:hypothetical protein
MGTEKQKQISAFLYKPFKFSEITQGMAAKEDNETKISPANKRILLAFSLPRTPKTAMHILCLKKIKFNLFIKEGLLKCLNPEEKIARFYALTEKTRELLSLPKSCDENKEWGIIGWVMASPRQRLVVLRSANEQKLTSEEIRARATQLNAKLTRISTKNVLNELIEKHLVDTEVLERMKFYWLTSSGIKIKQELAVISPLSPLFSLP